MKWISKWRAHGTLRNIVATMVGEQEKFLRSRRSRTAKRVTFWPCWQLFNSCCFETLSFFPSFPFFPFWYAKIGGLAPPSPVLPILKFWKCWKYIYQVSFLVVKSIKSLNPYQAMSFFLSQWFFTNKSVYLFYKSHENNTNKIKKIGSVLRNHCYGRYFKGS